MSEENIPSIIPTASSEEEQCGGCHCGNSCTSCQSGGGCDNCLWGDAALRGIAASGCGRSDHQLNTFDYLADVPGNERTTDFVEVQFKNTRKGFYRNDNHIELTKGDIVAVEAQPGHDIGVVTLTGKLVTLQMQKANLRQGTEVKRVYRKARPNDIEKYEEAKAREHETMIRARQIAKDLELQMKIGDVEYQGDGNKAIFYYIADQRVDFRKLIKVLAEAFHVRIEMKQIGARQEAGRIGGIGPCGRELCCATWMKNFSSVSTAAARFQDITPNPQKLAGQCAKLKCCLNYEVDTYMEAAKELPPRSVQLETADATYYFFKADTLARLVTYSTDRRMAVNLVTISTDRANEVMNLNAEGEKPLTLEGETVAAPTRSLDLAEQDDLTRFDKSRRRNNNRADRGRKRGERADRQAKTEAAQTPADEAKASLQRPRQGAKPATPQPQQSEGADITTETAEQAAAKAQERRRERRERQQRRNHARTQQTEAQQQTEAPQPKTEGNAERRRDRRERRNRPPRKGGQKEE